ncbi:hypothetical protein PBI_SCTP2_205 [Salicola phage SCTP-2]|nr:hypothetical protein PBI_SCTP2_205 [Salicola phage SCTP-2]
MVMSTKELNESMDDFKASILVQDPILIANYENELDEQLLYNVIQIDPKLIKFMKYPNQELQRKALTGQNISEFTINYINNPTEDIIKECIDYDPYNSLLYIKNIPEHLLEYAIMNHPVLLELIRHPSDKLQLLSLEYFWSSKWYSRILSSYERSSDTKFHNEIKKLKLTKGPMKFGDI